MKSHNENQNENWVYQGQYIKVSELTINGEVWEKAHFRGGVIIYPIDQDGHLLLIKEKRPHETPNIRLKPVTGIYEEEFDWKENANRELQEEIGFKAQKLELLLETQQTGAINGFQKFVLARDLIASKLINPDGEDTIQGIVKIPLSRLEEAIFKKEIPWSNSILGLFLILEKMKSTSMS